MPYKGQVVYIYAFDIAYDMRREPISALLGQPVGQFVVDTSKRTPRHLPFYRPQMVRLQPMESSSERGMVRIERVIKVFPVGAISVSLTVPFEVEHLEELSEYHDLALSTGTVADEARRLAQQTLEELSPHLIRPVRQLADEEAYTVFCINNPPGAGESLEDWLVENRRAVAAILTQEPEPKHLSDQEALESTQQSLSYYENDLVVVDWDAALVVDEPGDLPEVIHIMELANIQLSELETYDKMLDAALDRSYRDLAGRVSAGRSAVSELREMRVDLTRISDELSNITKFFGDWHLARVYQALSNRFHLTDWHHETADKLRTLDSLYQIIRQEQTNKWMMVLEVTIVLLFIIDLVVLIALGVK